MKKICVLFSLLALLSVLSSMVCAQDDPKETEVWSPVPPVVKPGIDQAPPSDAIVLFDGKSLDGWVAEKGGPAQWDVRDGEMTVKPHAGNIATTRAFADCQLHIEWRTPAVVSGEGQGRGNSGVFLQGRYEVQVMDSYNNPTYVNGQAASIYKQYAPLANASRGPGEWQSYDVIYTAPRFNNDGSVRTPAYVTVLHNGVLVQNHVEIKGSTTYIGRPKYEKHPFKQPLVLQEHGNPVSFRNIWIRELGARQLLNEIDTRGWYTFIDKVGKNQDPERIFRVENGMLHIEGKQFGYLATEESFGNYYLRVVFKWGEKRYPPRENAKRDSGVLYHFAASEPDMVWPRSIEFQVQEGDCGDYWCVGTNIDSPNVSKTEWGMKHILRSADFENPRGEWNTLELVCNGNQSEHYVNGHLVNSGTNASVSAGRILLQSEGAEVIYKSVEMIPY